jgi:hypothetical protein
MGEAGRYEIRVKGHLDARWVAWFDGMALTHDGDGTTRIHGHVVDQAALHGLLGKVRDVGLPLVSVTEVEPEPSGSSPGTAATPDHEGGHRPSHDPGQ